MREGKVPMHLDRVLLIANPVSQNGSGAVAAEKAFGLLRQHLGAERVDMLQTECPLHAVDLAREAQGYTTVIALGGDGVIHEVANGLMQRPAEDRPVMGIIPVGSGNDYARSLGSSTKVEESVAQLFDAPVQSLDVGCCNGQYFVETVSFGLDAAIAIDTYERRKRTGRTGTILYLESSLDLVFNHLDLYRCRVSYDGKPAEDCEMFLFAVQNGRTYGGGFAICPDADLTDGIFDICYVHPPLKALKAVVMLLMAKEGHHRGFKQIKSLTASSVVLEFAQPVPAQLDGERLDGLRFEISMVPRALNVIRPAAKE